MKRIFPFVLALVMVLSLAACGGTTAATMHLRRTEGTVAVSDGDGKDVPVLDNLGLYSGYEVGTRSASYAWIDLDDVKLAKLDQNSEISIEKEGKALDIRLKSGSLFFNVTQPLEDDETMNIHTSTLLLGIRGTSGWVEENDGLSRVYLLEGKAECSAEGQTVRVNAGEFAGLTTDGELVVKGFTQQDIPAFVRKDADPELIDSVDKAPEPTEAPGPSNTPELSETLEPTGGQGGENDEPDDGTEILEALRSAQNGDVITLPWNVVSDTTDTVQIQGGTEDDPVVLDLNGYNLTLTATGANPGFNITGALEIRDSSSEGTGGLNFTKNASYSTCSIRLQDGSHLFMKGGTITSFNTTVLSIFDAAFTMTGGTVNGYVYIENSASPTITIDGGTIAKTGNGAAIQSNGSMTLNINGGTITAENGNAIYMYNGNVTITGGTIRSENDLAIYEGGGTVTMEGGTIDGGINVASTNVIFNLNGGEVMSSSDGGTVRGGYSSLSGRSSFLNFTGGTITNTGEGYAVSAPSRCVQTLTDTVIRAKRSELFINGNEAWWPEGCAASGPDPEGYYYLVKS